MFLQEVPALKPACNNLLNPWSFLIHTSQDPSVHPISNFVSPFTCVSNRKPSSWPRAPKEQQFRGTTTRVRPGFKAQLPQSLPVLTFPSLSDFISTKRSNSIRLPRGLGKTASMRHRAKHTVSTSVGAVLCRTPNTVPRVTKK